MGSNGRVVVDGLRAWALSLPFVRESPGVEGDTSVHELVIDCPPLHIRRVWLLISVGEPEDEVLAFITHDDGGDVSCVRFTPPPISDPRDLEAALLVAYESAFAGCTP